MLAVWKDLCLKGQKCATRIDKVQAGKSILHRDFLRAQVLLNGDREVGAALHSGVVGDDHRLMTLNHPDSGDQSGAWRFSVVHAVRREGAEFEKRCAGIDDRYRCARGQTFYRALYGV